MIQVEQWLNQSAPRLAQRPWLGRLAHLALRYLTHEKAFQGFAQDYPHLKGLDFIEQVLEYFDFDYQISDRHLQRIPTQARVVIAANHPLGSLDGLALVKLVSQLRGDVKIVANEILTAIEPLESMLLPVDNMGGQTARRQLAAIHEHLENDGALIIFPAGEVSRLGTTGVKDGPWQTGFLRMARRAHAPIVPVYVDGRNSAVFYWVSAMFKPLSRLLLIKEMFKQSSRTLQIRVGEQVDHRDYVQERDLRQLAARFRQHVYRIAKGKPGLFTTSQSIAHPESKVALKHALEQHTVLGETPDGQRIYLCQNIQNTPILREIARLREVSFRAIGAGSGKRRDMDGFDTHYEHIVLYNPQELELVGAYRVADTASIIQQHGIEGLYTHTLFEFSPSMAPYFEHGLELGRSFVQPKYWGKRSLDYLWQGIGAYLRHNPHPRYLFGGVSLSQQLPAPAKDLLVYFYQLYFPAPEGIAHHRHPYAFNQDQVYALLDCFTAEDYESDFKKLKSMLANMGVAPPTLFKQYSEIARADGVWFGEFGSDPDFSDAIDGLVLVDLEKLKPKKRARYLGCNADHATGRQNTDTKSELNPA